MTREGWIKKWFVEDLERGAVKVQTSRAQTFDPLDYHTVLAYHPRMRVIVDLFGFKGACEFEFSDPRHRNAVESNATFEAYAEALMAYMRYGEVRFDPLRHERTLVLAAFSKSPELDTERPRPAPDLIDVRMPGQRAL